MVGGVDDLEVILNPVQQATLGDILAMTLPARRVPVTLAWCGLTLDQWATHAGVPVDRNTVLRWFSGSHRMPMGAAFRFARVLGVDPIRLFEAFT